MHAVTKLDINFGLGEGQALDEALHDLPGYSRESFVEHAPGCWHGDFIISCPQAPELAEGDFVDDFAPYLGALLRLQRFHDAAFELQISVGKPGPEEFELPSNMVALIAALGATVRVTTSCNSRRLEPEPPKSG